MANERVFTEEELRFGGLRSVDAIDAALAADDRLGARGYAKRLRREALSMRVNYDGWEATLLAWVRRERAESVAANAREHVEARSEAMPELPDAYADHGEYWRALGSAIDAALADARDEEARATAQALHDSALAYHDRGMLRVSALLSWLGRAQGLDALEAAYGEAMSSDMLGDASFRERAEALMHFARVHLHPVEIEEDDEKLTYHCRVCASGGRLIQMGRYAEPDADLVVQGPSWFTWGRERLPVYCCHEPVMERASAVKTGEPLFIVEPSEDLGNTPCKTYLYKRRRDIPERYYTRLGLAKPEESDAP